MIDEELLAEAKRRFPEGSIFNSLGGQGHTLMRGRITLRNGDPKLLDNNGGLIYNGRSWADIISIPTPKEIEIILY